MYRPCDVAANQQPIYILTLSDDELMLKFTLLDKYIYKIGTKR